MKRNNKKFVAALLALVTIGLNNFAQNTSGKSEDLGRISFAVYIPTQVDQMKEAASSMLANKLNQIVSQNGFGGSVYNERIIITPNIVTITKDLTPTAPPMTALSLEITFYIGDGVDGVKFASKTIQVKGVGTNETKAYIEGIKTIKPTDPAFVPFLEEGKNKIIKYYNSKCDFIIKDANLLASQNKQEEAIYKLMAIPDACKECYDKAIAAIAPIYKQKIDRDCKLKLTEATNLWTANQDINSANAAGAILVSVEPSSDCFKDIQALFSKIQNRVVEIDKREWNYKLITQQQQGDMIKAYRDVGVAYGNGQPKTISTNIIGWGGSVK